ncbi:MAG TPA: 3'-5' exonuclease [Anaerolineales bacterium]|nr:3'-5' exonuclease [Anaerolineales bacterium]
MPNPIDETYICVDIETAGPYPGEYSILSLGACTIFEPYQTFYVELKPTTDNASEEALLIHRLSLPRLKENGLEPAEALQRFEAWLAEQTPTGQAPIFVAFNAPFDWMFVNYYFLHYLGRNPFGHSALDIKAYYMGLAHTPWRKTSMRYLAPYYLDDRTLSHHALRDALDQAEIFAKLLVQAGMPTQKKESVDG